MSWNLHTDPSKVDELKVRVDELELAGAAPEVAEQVEVAKKYAKEILDSGVVGPADGQYVVNVGGHANPGHVPLAGGESDRIAIVITQAAVPSPEEQAPQSEGAPPSPVTDTEPEGAEGATEPPPGEDGETPSEEGTATPPLAEGAGE